jgi:DNA-binding transcriptional regulator PaaX
MCDALSRNLPKLPKALEIIVGHCLAHSRRRFVEVTPNFPEELAREQNITAEQRRAFHQTHKRAGNGTAESLAQGTVW